MVQTMIITSPIPNFEGIMQILTCILMSMTGVVLEGEEERDTDDVEGIAAGSGGIGGGNSNSGEESTLMTSGWREKKKRKESIQFSGWKRKKEKNQ